MAHLTLQEVIDRINRSYPSAKALWAGDDRSDNRAKDEPHRPEFYVPRITRRLASLMFRPYSS